MLAEARRRTARRLDVKGAIAVTAGASLLVVTFIHAEQVGWASAQAIVSLAAALGLLGAFVMIERRATEPLLPFTIFRSRSLSVANAGMILFAAGIYAMMFFLSLYLQQVLGYSPLQAGLAYIPLAMGLVFGPVGGRLLTVIGHRATMLLGLALATAGMAWFTRISADGSFLVNVLGPSLLIAAGGQFTVVGMTTSALGGVMEGEHGIASGVFNTSREIGGAFGVGALAALAAGQTGPLGENAASRAEALNDGLQAGAIGAAIFVLAALLVAVALLPRERRASTIPPPPVPWPPGRTDEDTVAAGHSIGPNPPCPEA